MTPTLSARDGGFGRWVSMRVLGMLAALAVLAGCGGGDPAPGNVAPVVRTPSLTVTMANGSGAAAYVVTRDAPLTVTATPTVPRDGRVRSSPRRHRGWTRS